MKYSTKTKPGMSDPYWYEWSVGEKYLLEMLYDESDIESVAFQSNVKLGLDDIVVYYKNGIVKCIQVKHSRINTALTFGNLVSNDEGKSSILGELATAWNEEKGNYKEIIPLIFTNRNIGKQEASTKTKMKFKRPALKEFFAWLKEQV